MAMAVVTGANLMCTFGTVPSQLMVTSQTKTMADGKPEATIKDFNALANIMPFGMCTCPANPAVQAATAAALGVFTPAPCIPNTVAPWAPATKRLVGGMPAIDQTAKCTCVWGGSISIVFPGQTKVVI
ncbi:MAG: DUF4280 domain-containing protein [Clostridia bacterium]|nr:DUF4280 domain-containing protein [Clostridia bacterium]